jgi:hypothetical protein
MKSKMIFLTVLGMLLMISLSIAINYSTAYFKGTISGSENAEENSVIMADLKTSFEGTSEASLLNAIPGQSVTKTFTITNDSDDTLYYQIGFSKLTNSFVNDELVYTLIDVTDEEVTLSENEPLPTSNSDFYAMKSCIRIDANTTKKYKFILTFIKTDGDQNDNMGKTAYVNLGIKSDSISTCNNGINSFYTIMSDNEDVVTDETDDKNLRYVGENPNNYIWFNCYDYSDTSTCERWRIIGLMSNVSTDNGKQSLIKIIRADGITDTTGYSDTYWDYTTSGENANAWDNGEGRSTLRSILNDAYYGTSTVTTYDSMKYTYSKESSNTQVPRGITTQTLDKIERVSWNVTPADRDATASSIYIMTGTTWSGYIGLMDPTDFGFATSGGDTGRSFCLEENLLAWSSYSDCYSNSWVRYYNPTEEKSSGSENSYQWTIRPYSGHSRNALCVSSGGYVDSSNVGSTFSVRPSLYLTSDVSITSSSESDGSYEYPYVVK